jgi:hypothetical protein
LSSSPYTVARLSTAKPQKIDHSTGWRACQTKNSPLDLPAQVTGGSKILKKFNFKKSFGISVKPGTPLTLGATETALVFTGHRKL